MTDKTKRETMRVLFTGGGTGGHIMPGAAAAEALKRLLPGVRCLFLTSGRASERSCLGALAEFETATAIAMPWAGTRNKALFPARAMLSLARSAAILAAFNPHVIVGLGTVNCIPLVLAGRMLGIRTALIEANAIPGRAVRALAPAVDLVVTQWPAAISQLRARHAIAAGTPVRQRIFSASRHEAIRRLALSPTACTLLVMGGSQGARALNDALYRALRLVDGAGLDLQVVHLTGPSLLPEALAQRKRLSMTYRPIGFLEQMEDAYAAADFVLSRAGAGTLAQLTGLGLPSILVPLPGAADDHQTANATILTEAAAAISIRQDELTPVRLADAICGMAENGPLRTWMGRRAASLGKPQAALTVARELIRLGGFADLLAEDRREHIDFTRHLSQAA